MKPKPELAAVPAKPDLTYWHKVASENSRMRGALRLSDEHVSELQRQVAELQATVADLRFERDRFRLAYEASYGLAVKIARECSDPEWIGPDIEARLSELRPDE